MKKAVERLRLEPVPFWLPDKCLSEHSYCELVKNYLEFNQYTAMDKSLHTIACLWSKMAFFKWVWQKVKVLSRP